MNFKSDCNLTALRKFLLDRAVCYAFAASICVATAAMDCNQLRRESLRGSDVPGEVLSSAVSDLRKSGSDVLDVFKKTTAACVLFLPALSLELRRELVFMNPMGQFTPEDVVCLVKLGVDLRYVEWQLTTRAEKWLSEVIANPSRDAHLQVDSFSIWFSAQGDHESIIDGQPAVANGIRAVSIVLSPLRATGDQYRTAGLLAGFGTSFGGVVPVIVSFSATEPEGIRLVTESETSLISSTTERLNTYFSVPPQGRLDDWESESARTRDQIVLETWYAIYAKRASANR